jgi:hypothetical protein
MPPVAFTMLPSTPWQMAFRAFRLTRTRRYLRPITVPDRNCSDLAQLFSQTPRVERLWW